MSAWNQLEQLLTCPICLDRFRNPKLLPCQHTFCGEPCMEGLVDYARRQIKCPECRAEHRLPYQGVQTFPNNVTLTRFLDLHRNVTGEEPEPVPSMMERCGICSEKSMVERCAHCEKKVCSECKEAHLEILRREISRINTQVRRGLNKINENLQQTEKNCEKLQTNHHQIREEITEIVRRFIKDLKDKEEKLLQELEDFTQSETKGSSKLKEDLEIELSNMTSNCELIEKHVTETEEEWTDVELVEYKEIFMKTLDFLRNFDPDTLDYGKKIKFQTNTDIDMLRRSLIDFGELKITAPINPLSPSNSCSNITSLSLPLNQNALMRSQSDHRLATQFQQRLRQGDVSGSRYLEGRYISSDTERDRNERASSPTSRRGISDRFGRYGDDRDSRSRFLRESDSLVSNWPRPGDSDSSTAPSSHFRSRFMRERERLSGEYNEDSHDSDYGHRSVRFEEPANTPKVKVFETEETTKGPLSGVIKLTDSPHLMQRLHQNEVKQKIKEEELRNAPPPAPAPVPQPVSNLANFPPRPPSRQMSEDEIEKQKKQNKAAEAAAAAAAAAAPPANTTPSQNGQSQVPQSPLNKTPSSPVPKVPSSPSSNSPSRSVPKRIITLQRDSDRPRFGAESPSGPGSRRESSASTTYEDAIDDESSDTSRVNRRKISTEEGNGRAPRVTTSRQISSTPRQVETLADDSREELEEEGSLPLNGSAMNRSAINGSAMLGSAMNGSAMNGSTREGMDERTNELNKEQPNVNALQNSESKSNVRQFKSEYARQKYYNETHNSNSNSDNNANQDNNDSDKAISESNAAQNNNTNPADNNSIKMNHKRIPIAKSNSSSNANLVSRQTNLTNNVSVATQNPVRRLTLDDFRGQERPNYNPFRQARSSNPVSYYSFNSPSQHSLNRSATSAEISTVSTGSSYRRDSLTSRGFPDSSNDDCAIQFTGFTIF